LEKGEEKDPTGNREKTLENLGEGQATARGGDGAAEFFGGFDPFLNDDFHVGESFLVSLSVGRVDAP